MRSNLKEHSKYIKITFRAITNLHTNVLENISFAAMNAVIFWTYKLFFNVWIFDKIGESSTLEMWYWCKHKITIYADMLLNIPNNLYSILVYLNNHYFQIHYWLLFSICDLSGVKHQTEMTPLYLQQFLWLSSLYNLQWKKFVYQLMYIIVVGLNDNIIHYYIIYTLFTSPSLSTMIWS